MEDVRQNISDFNKLYEQARESQAIFEEEINVFLSELREKYPGMLEGVSFEKAPLKTRARALDKINADYNGNPSRIVDLVRGRIIVQDVHQIDILRQELMTGDTPFAVKAFKDQFAEPTGSHFRAISSKVRLSNEHVSELRIEHATMQQAAKRTHDLYQNTQVIERRAEAEGRDLTPDEVAERNRLNQEARAIHDQAAQRAQLDSLLNENGRRMVDDFRAEAGVAAQVVQTPSATKGRVLRATEAPPLRTASIKLLKQGGKLLPVVGAGITGAIAAELLARAHGNVSDTQFALLTAGATALMAAEADPTNAGQLATEELIDAGLEEIGVPEEYRFGTTRQALQDFARAASASLQFSPRNALRDAVYEQIMSGEKDIPDSLQSLTEVRTRLEEAIAEINASTALSPRAAHHEVSQDLLDSVDRYVQADANWQQQFETLLDRDPQAVHDMIALLPEKTLHRLVVETASADIENVPPMVQKLTALTSERERFQAAVDIAREQADEMLQNQDNPYVPNLDGMRGVKKALDRQTSLEERIQSAKNALRSDPEQMRQYATAYFTEGLEASQSRIEHPPLTGDIHSDPRIDAARRSSQEVKVKSEIIVGEDDDTPKGAEVVGVAQAQLSAQRSP